MSVDHGADLKALEQLSKDFGKKAGDLASLIKFLQTRTTGSRDFWKGPGADHFREEWANIKPTFDKFVETLNAASKSAKTSHDNIQRATAR
ncbi:MULTISPECIES: WXG100 family type VII secretion target [Actinomycetes]|uniref:ESAT-6-like protein n=1 Tax=Streptomyces nondiastaticus TaxID=3154512 RepID=A0ABW6U9K9_9ACTN|nr:WXG100 family type VII secretion target [Streptosporangium nondiastaticum]